MPHRRTVNRFIIEEQRKVPGATGELSTLLTDLFSACKSISGAVSRGVRPDDPARSAPAAPVTTVNVHGEKQKPLDLVANEIMVRRCEWGGQLAGMVSEEIEQVYPIPGEYPRGHYLLSFDPLDGSSNVDVNVSVGSIFSILRRPDGLTGPATAADFLQPGSRQVCAGYCMYGPSTMLVLTFGRGVHGFTLDREAGDFMLTHPDMRIPDGNTEFAINASNQRFWEPPIKRYVSECLAGATGPRGSDFNMRWVASLVADVHRVLLRGGLFLYPRDNKVADRAGRLRLLYEANPMAMVVEAAGGAASTGAGRVLDVVPEDIHQRVPLLLGARAEVERIERYHREFADGTDQPYTSPLFGTRSLFMD